LNVASIEFSDGVWLFVADADRGEVVRFVHSIEQVILCWVLSVDTRAIGTVVATSIAGEYFRLSVGLWLAEEDTGQVESVARRCELFR
jgi:hypothetical protein